MRIGIDARLGFGDTTGLGTYTRRLIEALARHDAGNEYVLYTDRQGAFPRLPANFRIEVIPGQNRILWTNLRLPRALEKDRIDLFHGVANFELPLAFAGLKVLTIHDLIPLRFPETVPWKHLLFFRLFTGPALRAADRVLAVSEHTRSEVIDAYRLPSDAIEVFSGWVTPGFRPSGAIGDSGAAEARAARRHGLKAPYFVFVGVREPKKNLERLVTAFAEVARTRSEPIQLAVVGPEGWGGDPAEQRARELGVSGKIVFTGRVPESDLVELLQDARALAFPSLTEGFGLPVLEAMACGTAVVTSRAGALPEVAGDAALLVNPESVTEIAAALTRLLDEPALAASLGARGLVRAERWREEASAQRLMRVYLDLFNSCA